MEINVQGYKLESCAKNFCLPFYLIGRKIFSCAHTQQQRLEPAFGKYIEQKEVLPSSLLPL